MNRDHENEDLRERLADEAMAERPPFSGEIHRRVMRSIGESNRITIRRWAFAAAAAVLFTCGVVWLPMLKRSQPSEPPAGPVMIALRPPSIALPVTMDIGGIVSAKIDATEISLRFPFAAQKSAPPEEKSAPPTPLGTPDWLLAKLDQRAGAVQVDLGDSMPPELRVLARLANLGE